MTVLKQCNRCGGGGTVVRQRRILANGLPDPLDFRMSEICPACNGAGSVPERPDTRATRTGGWVADQITIAQEGKKE